MAWLENKPTLGDVLKWEGNPNHTREVVTLAEGNDCALGTVVGCRTADGEVAPWDPAATDGTEKVAGVLLFDVDATDDPVATVMVRREAILSKAGLVFKAGVTTAQKDDAYRALGDLGMPVRDTA